MDLPPGSMYNTLTEEVSKELGPVDPDWFNVLTEQASALEGTASDQEDLCANQEGNFKTPLEKTAVESQLFSTPKVFRRTCVLSPDTEDEQEKETVPWATRSPYLFHISKETVPGSKYGETQPHTHDCFDLLHTPQKSPLSYAQHISESLGANIHPDISWTSSLNTPPALPSTLILSKTDGSPCSVPFFQDKSVMFVRKLFPSLSNVSGNGAPSPHSNDLTALAQDADPPEVAPHPESPKSPQNSQNLSSDVWRQKIPDAIQDRKLRSTVASVLEGAENTLSVFFTNSRSVLRKVEADRTKRRLSVLAKEHDSGTAESKPASTQQGESDVEPYRMPPRISPVKSDEAGLAQWSPMSLSEITATTVGTHVSPLQDKCTAQLESQCKTEQPVRPSWDIPPSGFIKKKRTFVYTVEKERLKDSSIQGFDLHGKPIPKARDEADGFNFINKPQQQEEKPPCHRSSVQDLDMSQLCRAFAQDFSQTFNSVTPPKVPQPPPLRGDGFSPSACLTAMKVTRQKAKQQASLHCVREEPVDESHSESMVDGAAGDSGFLSAGADISHVTASSALPSSQQRTTPLEYISKELGTHGDASLRTKDTSAHLLSSPQAAVSLPSMPASGFKAAWNKGMSVSAANLQRAKSLLEEAEAQPLLNTDQPVEVPATATLASDSGQKEDDCQLTASQKADVTELCTLLEEADSQFEFTQFRTAKSGRGSGTITPKADKEFDPDFLSGIDFDDSFEAEKQSNVPSNPPLASSPSLIKKEERMTSTSPELILGGGGFKTAGGNIVRVSKRCLRKAKALFQDLEGSICPHQSAWNARHHWEEDQLACGRPVQNASGETILILSNAMQKEKAFFKDCTDVNESDSTRSVEDGQRLVRIEPVTNAATSSLSPASSVDVFSSSSAGFCTAEGRKVSVSAEAMVKAKPLLQEEDTSTQMKRGPGVDAGNHQPSGFQTAGGKRVAVSSVALKKAKSLLDGVQGQVDVEPKGSKTLAHHSPSRGGTFLSANVKQVSINSLFERPPVSGETPGNNPNMEKMDGCVDEGFGTNVPKVNGCSDIKNHLPAFSMKNTSSCSLSDSGFRTASVSDEATLTAKSLLNDAEKENQQLPLKASLLNNKKDILQSGGFQTALSLAAFKKAKSLFRDCEDEDQASDNMLSCPAVEKPESGLDRADSTHGTLAKAPLGFWTAGGKRVAISCVALKKAKSLFSDCHEDEDKASEKMFNTCDLENSQSVFYTADSSPHASTSNSGGFCTASADKVLVFDDAMTRAKSLLDESVPAECLDKPHHHKNAGFQTAGGKGVAVSSAALKKAKSFFSDCNEDEELVSENMLNVDHRSVFNPADSTPHTLSSSNGGFCTANGKRVLVSDDAITTANLLLDERITCEGWDTNAGFQTASGKGVAVSSAALMKEKSLFSDWHEDEDKSSDKKPDSLNMDSHTCVLAPNASTSSSGGFCPACGKKVLVSDDAMARVRSLLGESVTLEGSDEAPQHQDTGFKTASGKGVTISSAGLHKANILLNECNDLQDITNTASHGPPLRNCGFLAASGKPVTFSSDTLQKVKALFDDISLTKTPNVKDVKITLNTPTAAGVAQAKNTASDEEKPEAAEASKRKEGSLTGQQMLDGEIKQTCHRDTPELQRPEEPSVVNFQSLDMSDCTETQQIYLAQEALDCTKALLEDDSLARPTMTLESMQPKSSYSRKAAEKRSAENAGLTDQPPLKRSLLEEFDRTVNRTLHSPRRSRLCPQTSSPNGVTKDRPVFQYNACLHPNITRPHRDGMSYMEITWPRTTQHSSAAAGSRLAFPKAPSFVPPFLKKREAQQSNMYKSSNANTPPAFVPPFKKQRGIVQQNPTKPCAEEKEVDKRLAAHLDGNTSSKDSEHPSSISNQTSSTHHGAEENTKRSHEMMLENIELAQDMQDMRIMKKKRQLIRPLPGSLFQTKMLGLTRTCFKEAVGGKPPAKYTQRQLYEYGVLQHVSQITSDTAEAFRFNLLQFYGKNALADKGAVQLVDGGRLVPSRDGSAGKEQFYRALCDTPGVDPQLLSEEWVYNHYRWIVWKLASMERSFPQTMGSLCLTPERVLLQLKYRYDVEVDHSLRPALRKIMEHDDTSAKTLVLCVCGVVSQQGSNEAKSPQVGGTQVRVENPCAVVWLTDGWYAIKAQLDEPLSIMLVKGRLAVGGKIIVHGAQLVGSQEACSPLEAPKSIMLKIFANSSRPARWDTKLGFYRDPRPFLLPLSSLFTNGGPVGCVDIVVLRSYPMQWMERRQDEGVVFRSARAEEKEVARYNSHKQKAMEMLFAKIRAQFEEEEKESKPQHHRRTVGHHDVAGLQDGQELYETVGEDLAGLEAHLSTQQLETLQAYRRTLMDKKQAELQDRYRRALEKAEDGKTNCLQRDVTPVWRLCVADSLNPTGSVYQLNLWRPSSDLQALLKEGCRYKVYNLSTSDVRKRSSVSSVQLTGTKKTLFQDLQTSPKWLSVCFQPRVSASFVDLQDSEFQPPCGEVDLTGCVISVVDGQGPSPAFYLADEKLNFVKVRCFSSLLQAGLVDVVKPRVLLSLSNLQLRGHSFHPTPVVYAGDLTNFSTNPREAYLQESLGPLRNLVRDQNNFFLSAERKLSHLLRSEGCSSVCCPALPPKTPTLASDNQHMKPVRSLGCFNPVSRNPPPADGSTEEDPRSLKRRRALDFLSRVPSPPPLFHLGPAASPALKKTFNPPRRSGTPSTVKTVHTPLPKSVSAPAEEEWVDDEELAMVDTQALRVCDSH
ncbi:breast cancer type 2 susceptibility protein [Dunckerocampus dactyliophorus]|uniref:breast cancer type 2 susceptibility protein n=1 Tax=Dunckerocampus dactyliophorus TaxID=161453 RepID=UPI002405D6DA|nr:breast cancer type 2 susceptibility protein [Dunckerocampus dactyliophorus]